MRACLQCKRRVWHTGITIEGRQWKDDDEADRDIDTEMKWRREGDVDDETMNGKYEKVIDQMIWSLSTLINNGSSRGQDSFA